MTRLYLIDDHAMMRDGLRAMLEAAGHEVVGEAHDLTLALADIGRLQPELVLLDLNLGQRSGFELLADLQKRDSAVRVVVLTMSDQPRHVAEAMRLGAWGYVLKGSPSAELLATITAVTGGRRHLGAGPAQLAAQSLDEVATASSQLSPRERQILVMVVRGASSSTIGAALHLSAKTVDTYRSRSMAKLGLADVPAMVRWAIREGLIGLDEA